MAKKAAQPEKSSGDADAPHDELDGVLIMFGRLLKSARQKAGLTQDELSIASGVSQAHVSKIERGVFDPKLKTMMRLARAMQVSLTALIPEMHSGC